MPQTGVEELTARLLAAIDSQGNVHDMVTVNEVVSSLETMHITAEHLKMTRLGKHINSVRRQITDSNRSLAKRMKKLVKAWQQLLQARPSNGLATNLTVPRSSTPTNPLRSCSPQTGHSPRTPEKCDQLTSSPVKHDSSILTITSSSAQSVSDLFPRDETASNGTSLSRGGGGQSSDPAKNRNKLLKLLSKVKKPTSQTSTHGSSQDTLTLGVTSRSVSPQIEKSDVSIEIEKPTGFFSSKNFIPIENGDCSVEEQQGQKHLPPSLNIAPPPIDSLINDAAAPLSLCVSLPRESVNKKSHKHHKKPKRLKQESLPNEPFSCLISFPRSSIKLKSKSPSPAISSTSSTSTKHHKHLLVSLPTQHLSRKPSPRLKKRSKINKTHTPHLINPNQSTGKVLSTTQSVINERMDIDVSVGSESILPPEHRPHDSVNGSVPVVGNKNQSVLGGKSVERAVPGVRSVCVGGKSVEDDVSSVHVDGPVFGVRSEDRLVLGVREEDVPGDWFSSTDVIPGDNDNIVTVLPYIYIDGLGQEDESF